MFIYGKRNGKGKKKQRGTRRYLVVVSPRVRPLIKYLRVACTVNGDNVRTRALVRLGALASTDCGHLSPRIFSIFMVSFPSVAPAGNPDFFRFFFDLF